MQENIKINELFAIDTNIVNQVNKVTPSAESVNGEAFSLVDCGNQFEDPCTIDDLIGLANNLGEYSLKIIFPAVFFIGLIFTVYPILKDPNNPTNLAEAKKRGLKLFFGSVFVLGAYLLIKVVLVSIGVADENVLKNTVGINTFIFESAYAEAGTFKNPLNSISVQNIILGIVNILYYLAFIGIVLGIVRGVMLLMLGQENPDYVKRGKKWIVYTLLVAAIVFSGELVYNIIVSTFTSIVS